MRALRFLAAWLLFAAPADAQFTGASSLNGGTANPQIPDLSMCLTPPTTFAHTWYVDPTAANGGDGTTPGTAWNSLQALAHSVTGHGFSTPLLTTAGGGPVAPGDEVLLMNGAATDYGAITINNVANSSFVTIAAAPGQTPTLQSLDIENSTAFNFLGVSVQSQSGILVVVGGTGSHDIIFNGIAVSSADNATVAGWSQTDWQTKASQGVFLGSTSTGFGHCQSMINSHVFNTENSASVFSDNSALINNELDHWTLDDIDFGGNNVVITHNHLHDAVNYGIEAGHVDGMQGFGQAQALHHNLLIDSNTIVLQEDTNLPFTTPATASQRVNAAAVVSGGTSGFAVNDLETLPNGVVLKVSSASGGVITGVTISNVGLAVNIGATSPNPVAQTATSGAGVGTPTFNLTWQSTVQYDAGIGINNQDWTGVVITNNVIAMPNHTIGVSSLHDSVIAGNTVLPVSIWDSGSSWTLSGGQLLLNLQGPVGSEPLDRPDTNVVVRNNIVAILATLNGATYDPSNVWDHNILITSVGVGNNNIPPSTGSFFHLPGTYGDHNQVISGGISGAGGEIVTYQSQPPSLAYDFHLQSSAISRGYGTNNTPAPYVDIDGIPRAPTHDVGAHVFQ